MAKSEYDSPSTVRCVVVVARSHGEGSAKRRRHFKTDSKGHRVEVFRWQAYLYATDGSKVYGTGRTETEARMKARANVVRTNAKLARATTYTLREWAEKVLGLALDAEDMIPDSVDRAKKVLRNLTGFRPAGSKVDFIDLHLETVTAIHCEELRSWAIKELTRDQARRLIGFVRGLFKKAEDRDLVIKSPARVMAPIPKDPREVEPPTEAEWMAVYAEAERRRDIPSMVALILYYMGLRRGEICGATFEALSGDRLKVERQVKRTTPRDAEGTEIGKRAKATFLAFSGLKTRASRRTLQLDEVALAVIRLARPLAVPASVPVIDRRGVVVEHAEARFLVPGRDGGPAQPQHMVERIQRHAARAGLAHFRLHDFRAMAVSDGIEAGLSLKLASALAGHSGTGVTQNVYQRIRAESVLTASLARSEGLGRIIPLP